ncbi:MAG: M20/M25/M40 family metallo-hydrolase [Candidatus Sericytochromatia bacterium]|nr:M20/M25/M40 family metallo-hydrolase [Candidatus Sericytochromatia bacterium]
MLKRFALLGFWALCGLGGAMGWQTCSLSSRQPAALPANLKADLPEARRAAERLAETLRLQTVSGQKPFPAEAFDQLHALLPQHFPETFRRLQPRRLGHSLLIHWPGSKPELKPILLAAHLDVVPVAAPESWTHPPFVGQIKDGYIWGRGALDDKNSAWAILEALEALLKTGYQPRQGLYIALGEDEETGGRNGAQRLAEQLRADSVQLEAVLDEGLAIVPGSMIGLEPPLALIGLAEKGYLSVRLRVTQSGGHASMPPRETAVDILARALVRLNQSPMPARLEGPAAQLFDWLAPEMQGLNRVILANRRLFEPVLLRQLAARATTNALIRTTLAPTQLKASPKDNVLASDAEAVINLRLLPGDGPEAVMAHLNATVQDARVQLQPLNDLATAAASVVSSTESAFFALLARSIRQTFDTSVVAPSLVLAATDARHYAPLAENIYRFMPVYLTAEDLERIHGKDERISVEAHAQAIAFYAQLLSGL